MKLATKQRKRLRTGEENGFTLLELLIVIVVLGILSGIVVFALGGVTAAGAAAACNTDAGTVNLAVEAYDMQTGYVPGSNTVAAPTASNLVSGGYLQSFPSSTYYTITILSGVVMVAAPPTAVAAAYDTPAYSAELTAAFGSSGSGTSTTSTTVPGATTTSSTSTTTTTTVPASTTTTTVPGATTTTSTSTKTTTVPATNAVTITPAENLYANGASGGQDLLRFANGYSITSMTVTVKIAATPGVSYNSQSNSFPAGVLKQTKSSNASWITYTTVMKSGHSVPAAYSNGVITSQYRGRGTAHDPAGDNWTVTSTSNGITSTQSGSF
ncbi:MAG TPA: prepilin-type N-terminal cleavage/methylation domain-containing protein [Acidimicrobiales bacterium]